MKAMIALLAALGLGTGVAFAADDQPQPPPNSAQGQGSLSKKLSQSNGVIHPNADVDPGIDKKAPVPDPNSTPVIKPPGTPGGPPGPQPK
jgi:hypothetical protein